MLINFNIDPSACPSSVRASRDDSRIILIFFSFTGGVNALKEINSCTKFKADEIISLLFCMAVRYNPTNPIDTMMIKIVSPVAIVDSNGAIVVCVVSLIIVRLTT